MTDRQRLEAIVSVVCKYLPPDGISREQAMSEIIELVDPLPPQRTWVGLTNQEQLDIFAQSVAKKRSDYEHYKAIEQALKEKNQ